MDVSSRVYWNIKNVSVNLTIVVKKIIKCLQECQKENLSKNVRELQNDIDHENCPKFYQLECVQCQYVRVVLWPSDCDAGPVFSYEGQHWQ